MDKHLLVTVSDDLSRLFGVRFVCSVFHNKDDLKITLFYVAPGRSTSVGANIGEAWRGPGDDLKAETSPRMEKALANSRNFLCRHGFSKEQLNTKVIARRHGRVKDIIGEGYSGKYDAVVLGRRGVTALETLFSESVSDELLEQDIDFPLWICRYPEMDRKNILLCIDGSDAAFRMADHVGYIMASETDHKVTIFHVDKSQDLDTETIFTTAEKRLTENGVPSERIFCKTVKALRVGKAILDETEKHKYAVVATGLVGSGRSGMKNWFAGSKSKELVKFLEKAVLWTCR